MDIKKYDYLRLSLNNVELIYILAKCFASNTYKTILLVYRGKRKYFYDFSSAKVYLDTLLKGKKVSVEDERLVDKKVKVELYK